MLITFLPFNTKCYLHIKHTAFHNFPGTDYNHKVMCCRVTFLISLFASFAGVQLNILALLNGWYALNILIICYLNICLHTKVIELRLESNKVIQLSTKCLF